MLRSATQAIPDFGFTTGGTFWSADTDISVRTTFNLNGFDLDTIFYGLGADNGFDMYVNGNFVAGANAEGFTSKWEYTGQIPAAVLNPGANTIKIDLEDHGGLTAFDMEITGQRSVPDGGATAGLLVVGLVFCAGLRRRSAD